MKYLLFPLAIGSLFFSACGDKEASDKKESIEKQADAIDKQADATKDQAKAEAKQTEAAGDQAAKDLKAEADAKRDEKKDVK